MGIVGKFVCKWRTIQLYQHAYDVFEKRLMMGNINYGMFNANNLGSIRKVTTGINELETNAVAVLETMIGITIYAVVSTIVLMIFNGK